MQTIMTSPDFAKLNENAQLIVDTVGREAVDVYLFLSEEFARGPVTHNFLFQFVYRSYYRLDSAGLTPGFKSAYFAWMENSRADPHVEIAAIVRDLHQIPNLKGQASLQFSFVTKLAHTINPDYPIYDAEVAKCLGFRAPYNTKHFDARLQEYLTFYESLRKFYEQVTIQRSLEQVVRLFEKTYLSAERAMPSVKVLDFIFWSAGKVGM